MQFNLVLELCFILDAVIAGQSTHDFVTLPVVEGPGHVLARNSGHSGEIVLPDLLMDDDPGPVRLLARNDPPARASSERRVSERKGSYQLTSDIELRWPPLKACDPGSVTQIRPPEQNLM